MSDDLHDDQFELSLDDMLERVSATARADEDESGVHVQAPPRRATRPLARKPAPAPAPAPEAAPQPAKAVDGRTMMLAAWVCSALLAVGAAFLWINRWHRVAVVPTAAFETLPPPAAGRSPAPARAASVVAGAALAMPAVAVDPDASTEAVMLDQLRRAAGGRAGAAVAASAPDFAIARYHALPAPSSGWQVLAPLHVEELHVLVPAASPLRDLADLRGRRINVGAAGSARAASGEALYRTLFSEPLPASALGAASADEAVRELAGGGPLDALILFDGQPSTWLASLPMATRQRLKLLRLDPSAASSRRALQAYLPVSVAPALAGDPAPVPTLGEVTFLVASARAEPARQLLQALCERLPVLRDFGHPKWREVDPSVRLPVGAHRWPAIDPALQACKPAGRPDIPAPRVVSSER